MSTETPLQRTHRELNEAQERLRAEQARDPQSAAMAKAMRPTPEEQAAIEAAQRVVTEAEVAVDAAGMALARAERGLEPSYDRSRPFSFFEKSAARHKAAATAAAPGLKIDLEEARSQLQTAIRRRNDTLRTVEQARMERRRAAKLAHAPKLEPARPRNRDWSRPGSEAA